MATLTFAEARAAVLERTHGVAPRGVETVALLEACGRVLAEPILADRDLPPADRSIRDGYAVRACDTPGELRVLGELRAGEDLAFRVGPGEAVEIMTGALMPEGADAVVMVEHVMRHGDQVRVPVAAQPGDFVHPRGAEASAGAVLLAPGVKLGFAELALLAAVGKAEARVYRRPRVAIVPTGDEIVDVGERPSPWQVRNSNAWSLAAQVRLAGGEPVVIGVARDNHASSTEIIRRGLELDLLLLSGGVSAGKYDIVESVLADLGAEFYFDRVLIQPGQPLVFGKARGTCFFGLPGNPASTMVTFEVLAKAALERLAGVREPVLPLALARLTQPFRHKPGLTRFLPARLNGEGQVTPIGWKGSSDVPALTRGNAFLVADPDRESWEAGELIAVLLR